MLSAFGEAAGGECPSALNKNVHARPECPFIEVNGHECCDAVLTGFDLNRRKGCEIASNW